MKNKIVYVVFRPGDNDYQLGLNVYYSYESAIKMWEDRTKKKYDENNPNIERENGCYLKKSYVNP